MFIKRKVVTGLILSEEARKARSEYQKEWKKKNRDKVRESQIRYWEKVAASKASRGQATKQ